uniref:non-specific serine/threonine protein kinase n=1 Tax=Mougeotia scalaris TaxID=13158 RepID=Q3KVB2_MOUSC|nr:neochrome [Mougeotia scalaris]
MDRTIDISDEKWQSRFAAQSSQAAESQYSSDALLNEEYENASIHGSFVSYKELMKSSAEAPKPWEVDQIAYLEKMRRSGLTQRFGTMLVVEPPLRHAQKLHLLAHSENAVDLPGIEPRELEIGGDILPFFTSESGKALFSEAASKGDSVKTAIVTGRDGETKFYAICHRNACGVIIDLEPVVPKGIHTSYEPNLDTSSPPLSMEAALDIVQPAIQRLKAIPAGSVQEICDTVTREVRELLQYDRVIVYKFHPDQHGEVFAESAKEGLDPYVGLHYPSTDLPQAIRVLLLRVGIRMICDATQSMVKIVQPDDVEPVDLSDSTLRAPHGCHAQYMINMGSLSSITFAIVVESDKTVRAGEEPEKERTLWGIIVGHHSIPRFTPYPLRKAVQSLAETFGSLLTREIALAASWHEEKTLNMQKKLCDMLEADIPLGIVIDSPNIQDLVKCDGAALFFSGRFWLLGSTPTERQVADLAEWILKHLSKKGAVCTDSLAEAGYPNADELGSKTCGMVAVKVGKRDFVFWFREHTAKVVRWAGQRQKKEEIDDESKMMPRNSFKAFMEIVRERCLPWEDIELEAINGLRLMLQDALDVSRGADIPVVVGGTTIEGDPFDGAGYHESTSEKPVSAITSEVEAALSAVEACFLITDATQESRPIIYCSHVFSTLTGYSAGELEGGTLEKLEGLETDVAAASKLHLALSGRTQYSGRLLHYKKDGTPFWNLITCGPIKNGQNEVVNFVIVFQELAKYHEISSVPPNLVDGDLSAPEKGFPVSLIRYDGRLKEKSSRIVDEIIRLVKNPATIADSLALLGQMSAMASPAVSQVESVPVVEHRERHSSMHIAKPAATKTSRRRSLVEVLLGKGREIEAPVKEAFDSDVKSDDGKKRRAAKGIDLGTTLERLDYGFLVIDTRLDECPIIFMSDRYILQTQHTREENIGGDILFLDGEESSPAEVDKIRKAVQNNDELSLQLVAYRKNGDKFWALYHLSVAKDKDGNALYIINVVKDLGEAQISDAAFRKEDAEARKEAAEITRALHDLPDTAAYELWTVHSKFVASKPHRAWDSAWTAIKEVREKEGRLCLKHFKPIKPLGNGDSGSVVLVELRGTGHVFAAKIMEKERMIERNKVHRIASEREILNQLDHPFLPSLYASFQTTKHVCFITNFCPGGELYDFLEIQPYHRFEEHVAQFYAAEILTSLEYLHCQGVVYRDLNPENILLAEDGHIVLTDFDLSILSSTFPKLIREANGTSKRKSSRRPSKERAPTFVAEPTMRSNSFVGTEEYISPEIVTGEGHGPSIDWWSFGILIYEMLYGETPFCGSSMNKTFHNILNKEVAFPSPVPVSDMAKDLITSLLIKDSEKRLGSKLGAAEIKVHPFFHGINWPLIRNKKVVPPKVPNKLNSVVGGHEEQDISSNHWRLQDTNNDSNRSFPIMSFDGSIIDATEDRSTW